MRTGHQRTCQHASSHGLSRWGARTASQLLRVRLQPLQTDGDMGGFPQIGEGYPQNRIILIIGTPKSVPHFRKAPCTCVICASGLRFQTGVRQPSSTLPIPGCYCRSVSYSASNSLTHKRAVQGEENAKITISGSLKLKERVLCQRLDPESQNSEHWGALVLLHSLCAKPFVHACSSWHLREFFLTPSSPFGAGQKQVHIKEVVSLSASRSISRKQNQQ